MTYLFLLPRAWLCLLSLLPSSSSLSSWSTHHTRQKKNLCSAMSNRCRMSDRQHTLKQARTLSPIGRIPEPYYLDTSPTCSSPRKKVRGIFSSVHIPPSTLLGEYRGVRLGQEAVGSKRSHTNYMFSVFGSKEERASANIPPGEPLFVIDSAVARKSSWPRYVNAPSRPEKANCVFVEMDKHILIYSRTPIEPYSELLAWYGPHTKSIIRAK